MIFNGKIVADLGNSTTRAVVAFRGQSLQVELSNHFILLPQGYTIPREYRNVNTTVFKHANDFVANGEIEMEFDGALAPVGKMPKYEQITTKYSIILLIIKLINKVCTDLGDIDIQSEDNEWHFDVSVLLPAFQHQIGKKKMVEYIQSIKEVRSEFPVKYSIPVFIDKVDVFPEGAAAYTATIFKWNNGRLTAVEENTKFKKGYVLVCDIGAGTTDIVLIKDSKCILSTKASIEIGGNKVKYFLSQFILTEYGFAPSDLEKVIETGVMEDGNKVIDVSDLIDKAKVETVKILKSRIATYLDNQSISPRELRGVLFVGGGTLPTVRDGVEVSTSISALILQILKEQAPQIEQIKLGVNPRYANLEGLKITAQVV